MADNFIYIQPNEWDIKHTHQWIDYMKEYVLCEQFETNSKYIKKGSALVDYDKELFKKISDDYGTVLYNDFQKRIKQFEMKFMIPLGKPSGSISKPNVGSKHLPATLQNRKFNCLAPHSGLSRLGSPLEMFERDGLLPYCTETDIHVYVVTILSKILKATDLSDVVCNSELGISGFNPDIWALKAPFQIGLVEIKKPSPEIMSNPKLHGQTLNYMYTLRELHGQKHVFAIASTYDKFRVYWLPDSDDAALSETVDNHPIGQTSVAYNKDSEDDDECEEPPTPILDKSSISLDLGIPENPTPIKRLVYGTDIIDSQDPQLPLILYSVIKKMRSSSRSTKMPLIDSKRMYMQMVPDSWYWVSIKKIKLLYTHTCFDQVRSFIILKDLKGGAHGKVWLVCTSSGHVFVVKFSSSKDNSKDFLETESKNWLLFYPNISTNVMKWNDKHALMMPFISPATDIDWNNQEFIVLVENLIKDLAKKKCIHNDLHRRHVGKYIQNNKTMVLFFDLSDVDTNSTKSENTIVEEMTRNLFK